MSDVLVSVDNISKKFCRSLKKSLWYGVQDMASEMFGRSSQRDLRPDEFWAIKNVSFEIKRGECLGLVGRNGAGKTTLLRMLNGLIKPDHGRIEMHGKVGGLIALGTGFNPILTGRENVYVNASVLGLTKSDIDEKMEDIIEFSEISEFIDSPVQNYSSGMQVRLGFAVATALEPDILLLDEVLAVGDVAFRSKCFHRIGKLLSKCAVIFVSHDPIQMSRICDYCLYLKSGEAVSLDRTHDVLSLYSEVNRPLQGEQSIVLHPSISRFSCTPNVDHISWGESIIVNLEVVLGGKVKCGPSLLTLLDGEISVAQSDFTDLLNDSLQEGHEIQVCLGPLHLREGEYSLAVTVLDESKKGTLIHAVHCFIIYVRGPKGYGVYYQAPCSKG